MGAPSQYYVDPGGGDDVTGDGLSDGTAWATVQHALDNITRDGTNGDQINIKDNGSDVLTAALNLTTYGSTTATAQLILRGYTSTAGDGGIGEIDGDGTYEVWSSTYNYVQMYDLYCHNHGSARCIDLGSNCTVFNVRTADCTSYAIKCLDFSKIIGCSATSITLNASSHYVFEVQNYGIIRNCKMKVTGTNDSSGIAGWNDSHIQGNVIHQTNTGMFNAVKTRRTTHVCDNSIYSAGGTGTGVWLNGTLSDQSVCLNNIIEGFSGTGGIGIQIDSSSYTPIVAGNRYYNNATNESWSEDVGYDEDNVTLSASVFTNPAGDDFQLSSDADTNNAAWPDYVGDQNQSVNNQNHADSGALHRNVSGGGSTTNVIVHRRRSFHQEYHVRKHRPVINVTAGGGGTVYVPIVRRSRHRVQQYIQKKTITLPINVGGGGGTTHIPIRNRRQRYTTRDVIRTRRVVVPITEQTTITVPVVQRRNRYIQRDVYRRRRSVVSNTVVVNNTVPIPVHRRPRYYTQFSHRVVRQMIPATVQQVNQTIVVKSNRKVR